MSLLQLIVRSVTYHRRMHAGLLIGMVLSCGILTGALIVGDSVDYSLREIATSRLGRVAYALDWPNRFFAQDLAESLREHDSRLHPTAALKLRGMADLPPERTDLGNQLNRVQVIGVDAGFWRFAEDAHTSIALGPQEAAVNAKTAAALGVQPGDDLVLRVAPYGLMPLDAPLSSHEKMRAPTRLVTVKAVLSDAQLGRFSLTANQTTPYNVFVNRAWLQKQTELDGLANLIVVGDEVPAADLDRALAAAWDLEEVGLRLSTRSSEIIQLESARIFLDEEVVRAAMEIPGASPTLTYLVNSISKDDRMTPYSFVEAGAVPSDMQDDEIIISQWLAEQLEARPGDQLDMAYFQWLPSNELVEQQRTFTVRSVVSMEDLAVERDLAPQFPGLSDVDRCEDWDVGMPMDEELLKDSANEAYWKEYGQTPKLLVTFKAGQDMWSNRLGSVTAVRFSDFTGETEIRQFLRENIVAEKIGLRFLPVRHIADEAVAQAIDFGGLFVGMSFFLIVAALILLGLLYVFGIQQRASEIGTLMALGYTRRVVRTLFLIEACPTAVVGALLGTGAAMIYARLLLDALARYSPATLAGTAIRFYVERTTLLYGPGATIFCAFLVVLLATWRGTRYSPRTLLTSDFSSATPDTSSRRPVWLPALSTLALILAGGTALYTWVVNPDNFIEPFFSMGTFFLLAELGYYGCFLRYLSRRPTLKRPTLRKIVIANLARRRGRSLSVAGLTACGCFLVFAVSSMQENLALHAGERSSGTGGFALYAETTVPIIDPLDIEAVPLRVRDGDDASCLNLNRAQTPRVLGVNPETLATLGAFGDDALWDLLDQEIAPDVIPALVGDTDTALWGLKKKVGDVLPYRDESGAEIQLKLVGRLPMRLSVFQGSILISEKAFTRLFPTEAGFRVFLIDASPDKMKQTAARLNRDFESFGMEAVAAIDRLHGFYAVEASYLAMFLVLGGLGLILGAGGTGVVVLRNVFERRAEMAILNALGYERTTVFRLLFFEHGLLVLAGIGLGTIAAAVSILPLVFLSQTTVSLPFQIFLLAFIVLANIISIAVVLRGGLPKNVIGNLREE